MKHMDRENVIKGFTICSEHGLLNGQDCHGHYEYTDNLADIIKANDYSKQCPYNGCKTGCVKTLAKDTIALLKEQEHKDRMFRALEDDWKRLKALLKEQEAVEPKQVDLYGNDEWWGLVCVCPDCKAEWMSDKADTHFCPKCGRAVKWE